MIALASDIDALPETALSPSDMVPDMGVYYRSRRDGRLASVSAWMPAQDQVVLRDLSYERKTVTVQRFWDEWIHSDLYDPTRN